MSTRWILAGISNALAKVLNRIALETQNPYPLLNVVLALKFALIWGIYDIILYFISSLTQ
jgi:hypothetical protein